MKKQGRIKRLIPWVAVVVVMTPVILLIFLYVVAGIVLGPFENPPPPVKATDIEFAQRRLYSNLKIRWNFELSEEDRVVRAALQGYASSCWYLLQPGPDFDYEGLRTALLGEMNDPYNQYRNGEVFVDDSDDHTSLGSGVLDWWRTYDIENPDVIRIMGGPPDAPRGALYYFAIAQEDGLIYISHGRGGWFSTRQLEAAGIYQLYPTPGDVE